MTDQISAALGCPLSSECDLTFEIGKAGPDAALSQIRSHLTRAPHYRTPEQACLLLIRVVAGAWAELAEDPDRVAAWLASHGMGGELAPSPPNLLRAFAADLTAGRLPGAVNAEAVPA